MMNDINWFPGHMTKAFRSIKEMLKLVDMIIETCDARIPISSRNPEIDKIIENKPRLVVMNKADLADESQTLLYVKKLNNDNELCLSQNALSKDGIKDLISACQKLCAAKILRSEARGIMNRPIRAMVLGIPNTGKSTLINALAKKKAANTSDRPGVTRAAQWIRTSNLELLDMPGVLWPKLGSKEAMLNLAATGAIKDDVFDIEEIAYQLLNSLVRLYPNLICKRFNIQEADLSLDPYDLFSLLCKKRACIMSGGKLDYRRFSIQFVDEFRAGKIGKITLEKLLID